MSSLSSWRAAGSPWHLAQPLADLAGVLRRYGYPVGTIGDIHHLSDATPEDHTPYSISGWPRPNPYPWVHAIDIMTPRSGSGLPSLAQLGGQIVADRNAGVHEIGWLKYINWTNLSGRCIHESWTPNHATTRSGDVGHIHLSARTDWTNTRAAYDPVARIRGKGKAPASGPSSAPASGGNAPAPSHAPAVPPFSRALVYTPGKPMLTGADVRTWQGRMRERRWTIDVDGIYGPQSAGVCREFQRQKGLTADGIVGPRTWAAAWTAPVT